MSTKESQKLTDFQAKLLVGLVFHSLVGGADAYDLMYAVEEDDRQHDEKLLRRVQSNMRKLESRELISSGKMSPSWGQGEKVTVYSFTKLGAKRLESLSLDQYPLELGMSADLTGAITRSDVDTEQLTAEIQDAVNRVLESHGIQGDLKVRL